MRSAVGERVVPWTNGTDHAFSARPRRREYVFTRVAAFTQGGKRAAAAAAAPLAINGLAAVAALFL